MYLFCRCLKILITLPKPFWKLYLTDLPFLERLVCKQSKDAARNKTAFGCNSHVTSRLCRGLLRQLFPSPLYGERGIPVLTRPAPPAPLRCAGTCSSALRCCQRPAPTAHPAVPRSAGAREMGNKQLKSILPGSKPSTRAAASFFANLGQFTFISKAQKSKDQTVRLREHAAQKAGLSSYWYPLLIQLVKQSAGLETTQRDLPWLAEVQQGTDNGQKHLCSDHGRVRMLGKRKPAARVRISIGNSRPELNCKRKSGRSLDMGKRHTWSPLLPPQGHMRGGSVAVSYLAGNFWAQVTFNCAIVASLFIGKKSLLGLIAI